jgi:hypothetical protein
MTDLPQRFPQVGDKVEFLSDRQTEKGPSAGTVRRANWQSGMVTIRHSDHPGEEFDWARVAIKKFALAKDGRPLWQLV